MMLYRVRLGLDLKIYDRVRLWRQRFRVVDTARATTAPRKAILFKALQFDD